MAVLWSPFRSGRDHVASRLVGATVAAIALSVATGASAQARMSESFQFSDPLTGNYDCGAFTVTISGQDKGHVKT